MLLPTKGHRSEVHNRTRSCGSSCNTNEQNSGVGKMLVHVAEIRQWGSVPEKEPHQA